MQEVARQVAVAVDNVLHDESARRAAAAGPRTRSFPAAARGEQRRRLASGYGRRVRVRQHALQRVIQHDGCSLLSLRAGHGTVSVPRPEGVAEERELRRRGPRGREHESPGCIAISTRAPAVFAEQDLKDLAAESKIAQAPARRRREVVSAASRCISHDRVLGTLNVGRLRDGCLRSGGCRAVEPGRSADRHRGGERPGVSARSPS